MIPFPPVILTRNSSHARQPLSRVNVTGLLRRLQVKIKNIYLFKTIIIIIIKTWKRHSLKTGFARIFSCWPKNLSCPKLVRLCPPWITKELIALCKKERSLYKPRRSNKTTIWEKPQRVNNSVKTHCKTARWAYIERLASDLKKKWKLKPFWNFVKYKRRRTNKLVFLKIDIAVVTDDLCIAQCINSYFLSVFWYPRLRFCQETRKYQLLSKTPPSETQAQKVPWAWQYCLLRCGRMCIGTSTFNIK